jgi:nucleotidyltransferase substrate binding protein (TIGR01987 family)
MNRRLEIAQQALSTLEEILHEPFSAIVRDATIQRFEYTFEAVWKALREHLLEMEGIVCNSPKSCFREAFSLGYLSEEETVGCQMLREALGLELPTRSIVCQFVARSPECQGEHCAYHP